MAADGLSTISSDETYLFVSFSCSCGYLTFAQFCGTGPKESTIRHGCLFFFSTAPDATGDKATHTEGGNAETSAF